MKTEELIRQAREKLGVTTNYQLAKKIELELNRLHDYEKGVRQPDDYALTKLALTLERDPIQTIAEVRAENETNAKKREFWRNFLTRAASLIALLAVLHCGFPSISEAGEVLAKSGSRSTEDQIMRNWLRRLKRRLIKHLKATGTPKSGGWQPALAGSSY